MKTDAALFVVNMTTYSQMLAKKKFLRKLTAPPHKQTFYRNACMKEKFQILFKKKTWVFTLEK